MATTIKHDEESQEYLVIDSGICFDRFKTLREAKACLKQLEQSILVTDYIDEALYYLYEELVDKYGLDSEDAIKRVKEQISY